MPQFDAQGNIKSQIILDSKQFFAEMGRVQASLDKMAGGIQSSGKRVGMGLAAAHESWLHHATKVVLTFTLFYRAMNLVESGMKTLASQAYDTIKVIDDLNKQVIVTTATLVSFSKAENPYEAFEKSLPAVKNLMMEMEVVAARHIVTARQLQEAYSAFAKKGIFGGPEDLENIATIADTIAVIARQTGMTYQQMQEIYGIMEGQVGRGRELAYLLKGLHPNLKEYIEDLEKAGINIENQHVLLKKIAEEDLIGMKAALGAIWNLWETQLNTLKSYWNIIKRIGGEQIYSKAVTDLQNLNNSLVQSGKYTQTLIDLSALWGDFVEVVYNSVKLIIPFLNLIVDNSYEFSQIMNFVSTTLVVIRGIIESILHGIIAVLSGASALGNILRNLAIHGVTFGVFGENAGDVWEAQMERVRANFIAIEEAWVDASWDIYDINKDNTAQVTKMRKEFEAFFDKLRSGIGSVDETAKAIEQWTEKTNTVRVALGATLQTLQALQSGKIEVGAVESYIELLKKTEEIKAAGLPQEMADALIAEYKALLTANAALKQYIQNIEDAAKAEEEAAKEAEEAAEKVLEFSQAKNRAWFDYLNKRDEDFRTAQRIYTDLSINIIEDEYTQKMSILDAWYLHRKRIIEELYLDEANRSKLLAVLEANYRTKSAELVRENYGRLSDGMSDSLKEFTKNAENAFEQGRILLRSFADDLTSVMTEYFTNASNQARTFENFMSSIFKALANAVAQYISQLVVAKSLGGVALLFGSMGLVKSSAPVGTAPPTSSTYSGRLQFNQSVPTPPKFHSGGLVPRMRTGSGEVPAILKEGETVLPQGVSPTTFNVTIQAVDAASFAQLTSRYPDAILRPIINARERGRKI